MVNKLDLRQLKENVFLPSEWYRNITCYKYEIIISYDIQSACAEYGLETWLAPKQRIRGLAFVIQFICDELRLEKWLLLSNEIHVLEIELERNCYKNVNKLHLRQLMAKCDLHYERW